MKSLALLCLCNIVWSQDINEYVTIAPGVEMPIVNLGGVRDRPSNYSSWLSNGGRGLDTALIYGADIQTEVAQAIASSDVKRKEIFLTTKVPCCPSAGVKSCSDPLYNGSIIDNIAKDIEILGRPLDLLLLHWPCDSIEQTEAAYAELESALDQGITRSIGVSNFNASVLETFKHKVPPAVNQCGHSVGHTNQSVYGSDDATVKYCAEHGISYSCYSPLGGLNHLDVFKDPTVKAIAAQHNVSPAQIALRWLVQQNLTVVTSSNKSQYQQEDLDLFSFSLTEDEMTRLAAL